jgi:hypothetical protein
MRLDKVHEDAHIQLAEFDHLGENEALRKR